MQCRVAGDADALLRVFAVSAQSYAASSPQLARQLGRASMTLSMAGIAVSVFTIAIVVAAGRFHVPLNGTAAGNSTLDDVRTLAVSYTFISEGHQRRLYRAGLVWHGHCIGKCLGLTTSKEPKKDGCKIF